MRDNRANIELVIKISEEDYERLKEYEKAPFYSLTSRVYEAIANGTPLPKGHGKIGDIDELQTTICNKSASISDLTILKGVYFALQVIEDYMGGSRTWIADIPFVTGMSTDADEPIPKCETWSDCSTCEHESEKDGSNCYECVKSIENRYSPKEAIEIKYGEKNLVDFTKLGYNEEYPFTDDDGKIHVPYLDREKNLLIPLPWKHGVLYHMIPRKLIVEMVKGEL